MNIFFLFLPAAIVFANYLFSDLRDDQTPAPALARCSERR